MYPSHVGNVHEWGGCGWCPKASVRDARRRWGYHMVQHFGHFVCVCGSLFLSRDTLRKHRRRSCRLKAVLGKKWVSIDIFAERCGWEVLRGFLRTRFGTHLAPLRDALAITREGVFRSYTSESHVKKNIKIPSISLPVCNPGQRSTQTDAFF